MNRLYLHLSDDERRDLVAARDHDPRPYLRERAAALIKIADGASANQVAQSGLLKPRQPRTVANWVWSYIGEGVAGLVARPRGHRGCSPGTGRRYP